MDIHTSSLPPLTWSHPGTAVARAWSHSTRSGWRPVVPTACSDPRRPVGGVCPDAPRSPGFHPAGSDTPGRRARGRSPAAGTAAITPRRRAPDREVTHQVRGECQVGVPPTRPRTEGWPARPGHSQRRVARASTGTLQN